jgi:hypothetical protein
MRQRQPGLYGIAVAGLIGTLGVATFAYADDDHPPSTGQIAFAQEVSDLLLNELFAALVTEFDETTPANVPHGKQAISLLFNDLNRNMRLVGSFRPLLGGANNRPDGSFERRALQRALVGQTHTAVQKVNDRWLYRRSVPLSNFHKACVLCHSNFGPTNPNQWVGMLVLAVPIRSSHGG